MAPDIPLGIRPGIGTLNYGYFDDYWALHWVISATTDGTAAMAAACLSTKAVM